MKEDRRNMPVIPVEIAREPSGEVNEMIYGQFIEHILNCIQGGVYDPENPLSDGEGIRTDVLEKLRELAPPVMRFPGGTIMCQYHWEDAVGPQEKRIRRRNLIWGGELDPAFGTAEFVSFCRKLGAEPMICVNMASGTPEEAAHWVEYCNGTGNSHYANLRRSHGFPEPFRVKYWCIGNECYAEPDIGTQHDVNIYTRDAMEFIKWMKLTDKSIKTVIVGCDDMAWNKAVLDKLHPVTDFFSYHHYSAEGGRGIYGPFAGERWLRERLRLIADLIDTYPDHVTDFSPWYRFPPRQEKIKIALDEWNVWEFVPDETYGLLQTYNWRDALWTASVLNLLVSTPEIGMANLAQSVNVIAPVVAEREGAWYQTIAYPLLHYRHAMAGHRLEVRLDSPAVDGGAAGSLDALSVSAVRRPDGRTCVAAVNRDLERAYRVCLQGIGTGTAQMLRLEGTAPEAACAMDHSCVRESRETLPSAEEIMLPPGSVSLITISEG